MTNRILRLPEVIHKTGLSRSSIYLKIGESAFPTPVHLGPRMVGWRQGDIDAWIDKLSCLAKPEAGSEAGK
ncbi:AlpA family transcriptional regulator [Halioglobus sp. Uisw_031]|uniref:AlpA family transcriptional regulator n=1 Tax=Halioglobus sp. Uisw_031 TaxID=3230977 RepID=UPI0039EA96C0